MALLPRRLPQSSSAPCAAPRLNSHIHLHYETAIMTRLRKPGGTGAPRRKPQRRTAPWTRLPADHDSAGPRPCIWQPSKTGSRYVVLFNMSLNVPACTPPCAIYARARFPWSPPLHDPRRHLELRRWLVPQQALLAHTGVRLELGQPLGLQGAVPQVHHAGRARARQQLQDLGAQEEDGALKARGGLHMVGVRGGGWEGGRGEGA